MKKAILFDFFGTLVQYPKASHLSYSTLSDVLNSYSISLTTEQLIEKIRWAHAQLHDEVTHREHSMLDAVKLVLPQSCSEKICISILQAYMEGWSSSIFLEDGTIDMLDRMRKTYKLGIVSNTHHEPLVPQLAKNLGIFSRFDSIVTSIGYGYAKPHLGIYSHALNSINTEAEHTIFIGDSYIPDYVGPQRAGMSCILIDPKNMYEIPESRRVKHVLEIETLIHQQSTQ